MNAFDELVELAAASAQNDPPAQAVDTNNPPAQAANETNNPPAQAAANETNDPPTEEEAVEDERTQQQRHDDETEMIMDNIIADKSKVKYVNENVKMVMFLYSGEDLERLLKREFREEFDGVVLVEGRGDRHK